MAGGRDGRGARWPAERAKVEGWRVGDGGTGSRRTRRSAPPLINPSESLEKLGGREEAHAPSRLRLHPADHRPSSPPRLFRDPPPTAVSFTPTEIIVIGVARARHVCVESRGWMPRRFVDGSNVEQRRLARRPSALSFLLFRRCFGPCVIPPARPAPAPLGPSVFRSRVYHPVFPTWRCGVI